MHVHRSHCSLVFAALLCLAFSGQHTHGHGEDQSRRTHPDDMPVAVRYRTACAPNCVAGCAIELDVTVSGLAHGVTYQLQVTVERDGYYILHENATSVAWSREIGAHGASYSFWHMLPPLPAGRYMLLVSVIDASAQDHEAATLATVSMKPVDVREGQDRAANGTCLRHSYQRVEAREEDGSLGQVANTNGEQRVKCDRFLGCAAVGNVVIQHVMMNAAFNGMAHTKEVWVELTRAEEKQYEETGWIQWPDHEHIAAEDSCESKGWVTRASPRRVWDTFVFHTELPVLRLRLHTLSEVVHRFVLVEATRTFSNKPKDLVFEREVKHDQELAAFLSQVEHVIVDDLPATQGEGSAWDREYFQLNAIVRGTARAWPHDLIVVSDVDEIPDPHVINLLRSCDGWDVTGPVQLYTRFYNYNFRFQFQSSWYRPSVATFEWLASSKGQGLPEYLKHHYARPEHLRLDDAGWHLSFFSDAEGVIDKLSSYSHHDKYKHMNKSTVHAAIETGTDIFYADGHWGFGNLQDVSEEIVLSHCKGLPPRVRQYPFVYKDWLPDVCFEGEGDDCACCCDTTDITSRKDGDDRLSSHVAGDLLGDEPNEQRREFTHVSRTCHGPRIVNQIQTVHDGDEDDTLMENDAWRPLRSWHAPRPWLSVANKLWASWRAGKPSTARDILASFRHHTVTGTALLVGRVRQVGERVRLWREQKARQARGLSWLPAPPVESAGDPDYLNPELHRMAIFERSICDKCARRGIECGCEQGPGNPSFVLLRSYVRQYRRWQVAARRGRLPVGIGWVIVDVDGGAGNQQIHVIGALLLSLSLGRPLVLRRKAQLMFPFDSVVDWLDAEALIESGLLPRDLDDTAFLLDAFSTEGVEMLTCGNLPAALAGHTYIKFRGAYALHLPLINPYQGSWLAHTFHDLPFFMLSHFLWSGFAQRNLESVVIASRPPQPWDKEYDSLTDFHNILRRQLTHRIEEGLETVLVGVHVRTDTNRPMYYFDQRHVLPHSPETFCAGDRSSLLAVADCLKGLASESSGAKRTEQVLLWATDNDVLAEGLVKHLVEAKNTIVVTVQHALPTHDRHDLNCHHGGCASSGLLDVEFIGLADVFVGTAGSTFSFMAHARALLSPAYASFQVEGEACALPANTVERGITESGLLALHAARGPMHTDCRIVYAQAKAQTARCGSVFPIPSAARVKSKASADSACLGMLFAHAHVGKCLQQMLTCQGPEQSNKARISVQQLVKYSVKMNFALMQENFYARLGISFESTHSDALLHHLPRCENGSVSGDLFESKTNQELGIQSYSGGRCLASNGTWHLVLIWAHGLKYYEEIVETMQDSLPSVRIAFQKEIEIKSIDGVIREVYRHDIDQVGAAHIAAKTGYLNSESPRVGVLVVFDPHPNFQKYGAGSWQIQANKRLVDLKWAIRREFNPKLGTDDERDSKGVYSHHHVLHVSDSSEGVDEALRFLGLNATTSYLRSHPDFFTPWYMEPPEAYSVETISLNLLRIQCAATVERCRLNKEVLVVDSPHYDFALGNHVAYGSYYRQARLAGSTEDHTIRAFQRLKDKFDIRKYPSRVCGLDGIERKSYIIVNIDNQILDGAHRAALLMAANYVEDIQVVRVGTWSGRYAARCDHGRGKETLQNIETVKTKTSPPLSPIQSLVLTLFEALDDYQVVYVVLRGQPLKQNEAHTDIDVLVDNYAQACAVLTGAVCPRRNVAMQGVYVQESYFDLRVIGDHYYPDEWAWQMLRRRRRGADGVYYLHDEDQYYALLYHAVVHKGEIGEGYLQTVTSLGFECTLTSDILTWAQCVKVWMHDRFEFSETCHNCGGTFLSEVGLPNTCGNCAISSANKNDQVDYYQATVITAYITTGTGKHSHAEYRRWMRSTLAIGDPLVFYTDSPSIASLVYEYRSHALNRTLIVPTLIQF